MVDRSSRQPLEVRCGHRCSHFLGRALVVACGLGLVFGLGLGPASPALAKKSGSSSPPSVPRGFTIHKLAFAPQGATNCDDLAALDGHLFMTCQNMTQSAGGGGNSTLVEYTGGGAVVATWSIPDKADGITGDPLHHRLIVTLNEDGASHRARGRAGAGAHGRDASPAAGLLIGTLRLTRGLSGPICP
ncbi:MAG: hypothetical protein ACRDNK_03165 [Solirubrobacteraceae bacterium]